jgi:hypothetical protein
MALEELFADAERIKLRFVAGFDRLLRKGLITEAQFEQVLEVIDHLDDLTQEQLSQTLQQLIEQVRQANRA